VGLDIGPSTYAVVSKKEAFLQPFCKELEENKLIVIKLQKKMSRSLRLNNSQNYEKDTKF